MTRTPSLVAALLAGLFATALVASPLQSQPRADRAVDDPLLRDLFTGLQGDLIALKRGLDAVEEVAARAPDDAEALAWRGAATLMWSSVSPDLSIADRIRLFQRATGDMNRAVDREPDNPRVRLPRGAVLRILTPGMPRFDNVPGLVEQARADYQRIFDLRGGRLEGLSVHQVGELLEGLGDLHSRQDKVEEADRYYRMLQARAPGTEYAARAAQWLEARTPLPADPSRCIGCHTDR